MRPMQKSQPRFLESRTTRRFCAHFSAMIALIAISAAEPANHALAAEARISPADPETEEFDVYCGEVSIGILAHVDVGSNSAQSLRDVLRAHISGSWNFHLQRDGGLSALLTMPDGKTIQLKSFTNKMRGASTKSYSPKDEGYVEWGVVHYQFEPSSEIGVVEFNREISASVLGGTAMLSESYYCVNLETQE